MQTNYRTFLLRMDTLCIRVYNGYIRIFLLNLRHYLFGQKKNYITMPESTHGFEHSQLRGITIKNMIVTIVCTATLVSAIMTAYFGIKSDMRDIQANQNTYNKITDLRLKAVEDRENLLEFQITELKELKK